jgi:hypothetical protein
MPLFGSGRNLTPSSFLGGIFVTVRSFEYIRNILLNALFYIKEVCIFIFIMIKHILLFR